MKTVLWVSDEPNWAYDVNAKALSANQPEFNHRFIYSSQQGPEGVDKVYNEVDIIMAMNPVGFYMYREFSKVISILDTVRGIDKSKEHIFSEVLGIICNNQFLFDYASKLNKNVILQPNGVDLNVFKPHEKVDKEFTMGFAGNVTGPYANYKGYNLYQEAMKSFPGVKQLNVLYGTSRIAPDRMAPDFYNKIDCLILPSINEGCSNVIVEALACGVPVICTKIGYHGHSLEHGKQCLFVERTVESIKNAIIKMRKESGLMRTACRHFACKNHDIEIVAKNYSKFFEKVL